MRNGACLYPVSAVAPLDLQIGDSEEAEPSNEVRCLLSDGVPIGIEQPQQIVQEGPHAAVVAHGVLGFHEVAPGPFGSPAHAAEPPVTDDPSGGVTTVIRSPGSPGAQSRSPVKYKEAPPTNPCTTRYDPTGMVGENYDWDQPGAPTEAQLDAGTVNWYAVACPGQPERTMWTIAGQPAPDPPPPTPGELAVTVSQT